VHPDAYTAALRGCLDEFWAILEDVRAKVPITPVPMYLASDAAPTQSDEDAAYAAACGGVRRDVTLDPHN
jgi:hypothetical protein